MEHSLLEGLKVESRAPNYKSHLGLPLEPIQCFKTNFSVLASRESLIERNKVIQMMGKSSHLFRSGLSTTNFESTIGLNAIAVNNLAMKSLGELHSQS